MGIVLQATLAFIAITIIGIGICAMAPVSASQMALATAGTTSVDNTAKSRFEPGRTCDDMEVWFLDPTCSKKHRKAARLNAARHKYFFQRLEHCEPDTDAAAASVRRSVC